jgi:PAS domain S-box-containing protein
VDGRPPPPGERPAAPYSEGGDADEPFRLLVESVRDYAIFMLDPRGRVVTWNLGAERIKGYRRDEIVGKHFSVFYPRDEAESGVPDGELVEAARIGRVELEGWRVRKDGSWFWANVVITALRSVDGTLRGFAKVTRDLTARREAEHAERRLAAEQAARAAAERAAAFQRNMTAIVGHDLRTPLSVIITAAAVVHRSERLDPELSPQVSRIMIGARRVHEIVSTLLDYAHALRPDGIPINPKDGADIDKVCKCVVQLRRTSR